MKKIKVNRAVAVAVFLMVTGFLIQMNVHNKLVEAVCGCAIFMGLIMLSKALYDALKT